MNNVTNTTSSNLVHSMQEKRAEWQEKSKKCPRDLALKVAAIALLFLLALAVTVAPPFFIPLAASVGVFVGTVLGLTATSAALVFGATFMFIGFDLTNYRNPKNVLNVLSDIKNAKKPLSLSYFERLHRHGVISDQELKEREGLEDKAKEYKTLTNRISEMNNKISSKTRELKKLKNLEAFKERRKSIEAKIERLKKYSEKKEKRLKEIKTEFKKFHEKIVDFNPYTQE